MDIGRSFTYMFDDESWIGKILIGGIIGIVPILNFAVFGYMLEATKNVTEGKALPLPDWGEDFGGKFMKGLLGWVIAMIYAVPIWVILCLLWVVTLLLGGGATMFESDAAATGAGGLAGVIGICFYCLMALYGIAMIIWLPAALTRFAVQGDFGSAFQFGEIRNIIQANLGNYLLAIVIAIVAMAVAEIVGAIACGVGMLFTIFWAYLVYAFLMGNVWLEAQAEPA